MAVEHRKGEIVMGKSATDPTIAEMEVLRNRHNELSTRKTRAETNLENSRIQLEKLRKQARELYGTDDLEALKTKLSEIKAENEAKTSAYRRQLGMIEANLQAVEEKYKNVSENTT